MDGVLQDVTEGFWRTEVVAESSDGVGTSASGIGPDSQKVDEEVTGELD